MSPVTLILCVAQHTDPVAHHTDSVCRVSHRFCRPVMTQQNVSGMTQHLSHVIQILLGTCPNSLLTAAQTVEIDVDKVTAGYSDSRRLSSSPWPTESVAIQTTSVT